MFLAMMILFVMMMELQTLLTIIWWQVHQGHQITFVCQVPCQEISWLVLLRHLNVHCSGHIGTSLDMVLLSTMQTGVNHNVPVVVTMRGKKVHHTLRQKQRHPSQGQGKRQGIPYTTLEVIHKRLEEFNQNQECLTMTNLHKMYPA